MDGMFRSARWHGAVALGRCCSGCCGRGRGGGPHVHELGGCFYQNGWRSAPLEPTALIGVQVDTLPTRSQDTQPLTNVLSISTAGKNRFLFHFSSVNALTQWTAGIRLAMFENSSLQEAYTGSLIAGKGKTLNNIRTIMERTRFKTDEWTRVRFGAGTPWRRCWCVISPADEKELAAQRKAAKKRSAYDRSLPHLKGDIKFYDTRKITKKTKPIATIKDAYSAYAIYPQSKPLIEQSTLIKIEGVVTIHTSPEVTTEGVIFVMPEVRPAISGFEMMLRFLFPIYDIFALYGRPARLIADTLDSRSLMFAMPSERRYGYLEVFDVATLIHQPGSTSWSEREWKKQLKLLTSQRITKMSGHRSRNSSRVGSHRNSMPGRSALRFQDNASTPSLGRDSSFGTPAPMPVESAPPGDSGPFTPPRRQNSHQRSASETHPTPSPRRQRDAPAGYAPSRLSQENHHPRMSIEEDEDALPPLPPAHGVPVPPIHAESPTQHVFAHHDYDSSDNDVAFVDASDHDRPPPPPHDDLAMRPPSPTHAPVVAPPAFLREPGAKPQARPYQAPELRRANSRMSSATLSQLAAAGNMSASQAAAIKAMHGMEDQPVEEGDYRGVNDYNIVSGSGMTADDYAANQGLVMAGPPSKPTSMHSDTSSRRSVSPSQFHRPLRPTEASSSQYSLTAPATTSRRSASPLHQAVSVTEAQQSMPTPPSPAERPLTSSSTASDPQQAAARPFIVSRKSLARKPVPSKRPPPTSSGDHPAPQSPSSIEQAPQSRGEHETQFPYLRPGPRRDSDDSSRNGAYSTDSPDYASTRESVEVQQPAMDRDRPRSGVLRTVGNIDPSDREVVIGDSRYRPSTGDGPTRDDFGINFGPTQLYNPGVPNPKASADNAPPHGRSQSRSNMATPEPAQSRPGTAPSPSNRRSIAWQPGVALGSPGSDAVQAMTPEQFVQQRYEAGRAAPPLAHARQLSSTPPRVDSRQSARTPPLGSSRNSSGDWTAQIAPGQFTAQGQPPRPGSRGANRTLSSDLSSHLSAREQEHVARMTGSPLINVGSNTSNPVPQGGLVGAIDAREREKKDFKNYHSNLAVQQTIAHRQQTQQQQQYYGAQASPGMYIPGQFPPSPQHFAGGVGQQDYVQTYAGMPSQQAQRFSQGYYPAQTDQQKYQGTYHQSHNST